MLSSQLPLRAKQKVHMLRAFRVVAWIGALALLPACTGICQAANQGAIPVVLRYDDYSSVTPTALDSAVIALAKQYHIPITIAVIPNVCSGDFHSLDPETSVPLTPQKAAILRDAIASGIVEVALHGYTHQTVRDPSAGGYTEFQGVDYNTQYARISAGKRMLEGAIGRQVVTFVPPWNTYDSNTLRALNALGFSVFSADQSGTTYGMGQLKSLPENASTANIVGKIQAIRQGTAAPGPLVVLMHPYEFADFYPDDSGWQTLQSFEQLLQWLVAQTDVQPQTLAGLALGQSVGPLKGDLNGDGQLDIPDVTLALRMVIGTRKPTPWDVFVGDMNGDGVITMADAIIILRTVAGVLQ